MIQGTVNIVEDTSEPICQIWVTLPSVNINKVRQRELKFDVCVLSGDLHDVVRRIEILDVVVDTFENLPSLVYRHECL